MKKNFTIVFTFLLLIQVWPFQALAQSNDSNEDLSFEIALIYNEKQEKTEMIKDNVDESETSGSVEVENFTFVKVIESDEHKAKVKILIENESSEQEEVTGFIDSKHLIFEKIEEFLVDKQIYDSIEEVEKLLETLYSVEDKSIIDSEDNSESVTSLEDGDISGSEDNSESVTNLEDEDISGSVDNSSEDDTLQENQNSEESDLTKNSDEIDIETNSYSTSSTTSNLYGVALETYTNVYSSMSKDSEVIRSYSKGHILKYQEHEANWYIATVFIDGQAVTGFINVDDVDTTISDPQELTGFALKDTTPVYTSTSKDSEVLKNYNPGQNLIYSTFSSDWYKATIYIDGVKQTGYFHINDVGQDFKVSGTSLNGVALNNQTHVYSDTSSSSKQLKTYNKGHILKYSSYNSDWFEATVYVNGSANTGYIRAEDVETADNSQSGIKGIGVKAPTNVYSSASTDSSILKDYSQGHILSFRSFTSDWYGATVYINGARTTGYIKASDVDEINESGEIIKGIGLSSSTHVYSNPTTSSDVLKSYNAGKTLIYKPFSSEWFEATLYMNGDRTTGYISASTVDEIVESNEQLEGIGFNDPTNIFSLPSLNSQKLKSYSEGHKLIYRPFTSEWYEASVYINGSKETGYIHSSHIVDSKTEQERLEGISINNETNVYTGTSEDSDVLKTYSHGQKLIFKSYTTNWYEATVYVNGERNKGYIHKNDIFIDQEDGYLISEIRLGVVSANNLNVRSGPGTNHHSIGELENKSVVNIISKGSNGWYTILFNGGYGYVSGSYIIDIAEVGEDFIWDEIIGYVNSNSLNVRSSPVFPSSSSDDNKIDSLSKDTRVEIISTHSSSGSNSWHQIRYDNNKTGYVSAGYIQLATKPSANSGPLAGKTIILDAGHGAQDPGGIGGGMEEKNVVLDITLRAEELLREAGAEVIMTRRSDFFLALGQRSFVANRTDADVFVSIHANIFNGTANGTETFWNSNYRASDSKKLAHALQDSTVAKMDTNYRRVVDESFSVIRRTQIPSALLEVAFMDNKDDAAKLRSDSYRDRAAEGIRDGLINYFK